MPSHADVILTPLSPHLLLLVFSPPFPSPRLPRLYAHLKPATGVLFLVLPLRCVNSRHVGGQVRFDALLAAMGFSHLIEMRYTPRLVFYVLGRDRDRRGKGKVGEGEGGEAVEVGEESVSKHAHLNINTDAEDSGGTGAGIMSWKRVVQSAFQKHSHTQMARGSRVVRAEDHFCRDFSGVPSSEFCLSMSTVLDREGEVEGEGEKEGKKKGDMEKEGQEQGQGQVSAKRNSGKISKGKGIEKGEGHAKKKRKDR